MEIARRIIAAAQTDIIKITEEYTLLTLERITDALKQFFTTYLITPVTGIGVKDVIDILLLSLVLYFVYRLIRDSRAWKLLVGLCVLFIVSILAKTFEMNALSFIFGNVQQIGILAILVLFQPEFRMALERVGETPITGIRNIAAETGDLATLGAEINAICTAANDLSRERVGALIVIERSSKLSEYIKSGVYLDAAISPHLLRNLFFNKAPLHDGAVIIRERRVCAAGCFLPLSTKQDINKDLGTRHRAAIGMTEVSDAVVIIVSEETGTISVSVDGNLERGFNYASLKQRLYELLAPQSTSDTEPLEHIKKSKRGKSE
ncbi:MAG: diadenylate cyclase CdaA [Clostridia bacterium]|nr:diadenylate cyclase CdaA [Clostridia bacterium]